MKDWLGKEIEVGSRIVYPQRASSSLWMVLAEVVEVVPPNPDKFRAWREDEGSLKVRRLEESGYGGAFKRGKVSTLTVLDRVTVVTP